MPDVDQVPDWIAKSEDREGLERVALKAGQQGKVVLQKAALERAWKLAGLGRDEPLDQDVQAMLAAREYFLFQKHGYRQPAGHARRKIKNRGNVGALESWALGKKPTDGFTELVEAGLAYFAGESIVLRHKEKFSSEAVASAEMRLRQANVDIESILK